MDQQYIERLLRLARRFPAGAKFHILAMDYRRGPDGKPDLDRCEFYTPNPYVLDLAEKYPDILVPVVSVHPFHPEWREELAQCAKRGARVVKWLPNAQGIDPGDDRLDGFYRALIEHDMVLLTHVGEERAVETPEDQELGNPLRLRRALDLGVKVIMAHCGSLGTSKDLDHPGEPDKPSFDLFMRLMRESKYEGLLFADISATTQFNRLPRPLIEVMSHPELHHRLVNGTDYPLPAINLVIQTRKLVKHGMITREERKHLNEVYDYNPLVFDFVVKRTICFPGTRERMVPAQVFVANPGLGR